MQAGVPAFVYASAALHCGCAENPGWCLTASPAYPPSSLPVPAALADVANWALVLGVDGAVLYFWGVKSLAYLLAGSLLGGGLHPMAGHLIAGARVAVGWESRVAMA